MVRKNDKMAVLFADIAESTMLYKALGDKTAQNLISSCLNILGDVTRKHQGVVIKTIGDEVMCAFPSASLAVEAGKAMHKAVELMILVNQPSIEPPNLYIGIHFGPVIIKGGDVFGDTVNVAAHITELAKQRQILISQQVFRALKPELRSSAKCVDTGTIRDKKGVLKLYETIWDYNDMTVVCSNTIDVTQTMVSGVSMELFYKTRSFQLSNIYPRISMGRQSHNEIVVGSRSVSRSHAVIELRRGRFILMDQSSNGTYIYMEGRKVRRLKQDETRLMGSGIISLGEKAVQGSSEVIRFKVKLL